MKLAAFSYCATLEELLHTGSARGKTGKEFSELGALSTVRNLVTLRTMMMEFDAQRTLEVGLCYGGSALVFTASHRDLGHPPNLQHMALDPFQEQVWDSVGLACIEKAGLDGYLSFHSAFSSIQLPKLLEDFQQDRQSGFDLIYVDGSHIFEDVFIDAYYSVQLLNQGGVVCFDDSTDPHVAKVLKFIRRAWASSLAEIDLNQYGPPERLLRTIGKRVLGRYQMTAFRRMAPVVRAWDAPFVSF